MLARMSSRQLAEWMAYDAIDPFGEERADLRSAIVATQVSNAWFKKATPFSPMDFMPFREKRLPTLRELERKVASVFGGF